MKISIVALNWNGKDLLKKSIPPAIKAADYTKKSYEIILVDNGSTDGSIEFVKSKYPKIKIISFKENMGFIYAMNTGVRHAKGDYLVPLNNDIILKQDSLKHMLKHFKNPKVFGTTPKILRWDKKTIQSEFLGCTFVLGTVVQTQPGMNEIDTNRFKESCLTFYAPGGSSMIDRKKFLKLGGFDEIYSPFYSEEPDLSYRAYKRGWVVIYEPKAVVYHKGQGTLAREFSKDELQLQELKNRFIFTWSNFYDPRILLRHFGLLPFIFLRSAFVSSYRSKRFLDVMAFFQALKHYKEIMRKRQRDIKYAKLSDKEALSVINSNNANKLAPVNFRNFLGF